MDSINTFSVITMVSFLLLAPVALLTEGMVFTPGAMAAMGIAGKHDERVGTAGGAGPLCYARGQAPPGSRAPGCLQPCRVHGSGCAGAAYPVV